MSASSFPTALVSRPVFSTQQQTWSETSHSSPTKRLGTTASLLQLAVPIRFVKEPTLEAALSAVAAGEALLPAVLKLHPDCQNDSPIRQHTWCDETTTRRPSDDNNEHAAAVRNHERLRAAGVYGGAGAMGG